MSEEENKDSTKKRIMSRREFLKDAGLVAGGIGTAAFLSACSPAASTVTTTIAGQSTTLTATKTVTQTPAAVTTTATTTAPGITVTTTAPGTTTTVITTPVPVPAIIKLTVNKKQYEVQVEPNWTLQRTLQFKLGLTGSAKTMCDRGECGSCTVIMNGRAVLSCTTLTAECAGKSIETIEGIAESKHPLIYSYMKWDCMQCGYCTPGFLVSAKALLDKNPNPTEADVKQALSGNICRCCTQLRHTPAVLEAAQKLRGG
jgi:aerobic-type carbon monoxide dehydrogenase small subunit (CoxS/CutS family)